MRKFLIFALIIFIAVVFINKVALGQFFVFLKPLSGEKAPDFTLNNLVDKNLSLNEVRDNKKAIMFFWATWCPHCREALKDINRRADEFEKNGVKIILIDVGEPKASVERYVKSNKIILDSLLDVDSTAAETYQVVGLPTFFYVGEDGIVKDSGHELFENYLEVLSKIEQKQ